jgi:hypothetical protein
VPAQWCLACARRLRSRRLLGVLATLTALGLGTANPAFASGGGQPDPTATLVTPVVAVPEPEVTVPDSTSGDVLSTVVELPQVETSVQTDGTNTNVSVRVLSPGSDGPVQQKDLAPGVVSGLAEPDITTVSASSEGAAAGPSEAAVDLGSAQAAVSPNTTATQGANTNVSVRVLSPGDDGPVTQLGAPRDDTAPSQPTQPSSTSPDITVGGAASGSASTQYQDENSQNQFADQSNPAPWEWTWTLASNCSDIADSSSATAGDSASLDWHWEWVWNWDCTGIDDPTGTAGRDDGPSSGSGGHSASGTTSSGNPTQAVPSAATQVDGTWAWTWTFDLCGTERTVSTTTASGTPLTWDWNWAWTWTCPAAEDTGRDVDIGPVTADTTSQVAPSIDGASVPSDVVATSEVTAPMAGEPNVAVDPAGTFSSALQLVRSLVSVRFGGLVPRAPTTLTGGFEATSPALTIHELGPTYGTAIVIPVPGIATGPAIVVQTPPATLPSTFTDLSPAAGGRQAARRPRFSAPTSSTPPGPVLESGARASRGITPPATPEVRPAPRPRTSSTGARQRHDSGPLPFDFEGWLQLAGATTGTGNSVGVPQFGFATVTGFFALAPPRLRERVRPAQELGPRDRYPSPIDHPG